MKTYKDCDYTGDMVLGMHDAIVSLTGLIAGLAFTLADRYSIIMSAIVASVAASLSMAASNYLAARARGDIYRCAITSGVCTGAAYVATCVALILPFLLMQNITGALAATFIIAVAIIFLFNLYVAKRTGRKFWPCFLEMLMICVAVSVIAFLIGEAAKYFIDPAN